ncbi:hypothetical protein [Natrialbaceae archaeon AArc-T1-2]|uniref:hypothetical protein n=1 Tax=Natrialbaceae archaeon AArc-T1-2 TaxID=3053904 RepID=UPI00255AAD90|nr:hypothetical protein [Natrialbaceae archaeon AArc-T1-2]WIV67555.1 hypothetical protein QQ977_02155 [Natrialbaceae archaeon AArc-T1-2]
MERKQSDQFAGSSPISYLADFPGANPAEDTVEVTITGSDDLIEITPSEDITVDEIAETVDVLVSGDVSVSSISETVTVQEDTPLDVSGSTVTVQEDTPISVSSDETREIGKARVQDSSGVLVDPLDADDMTPVSSMTSMVGKADAASIDLGPHRKDVDVYYDVTGAATVTIEVSADGDTWRELREISTDDAETSVVSVSTSYQHVRAYADENLETIEIASKGS